MSALQQRIIDLHAEGLGRPEIAAKAGCSRVYAWMVLKAQGVDIPPRGYHARKPAATKPRRVAAAPVRSFSWERT